MIKYKKQEDRVDTNSSCLMVFEIGKENEGLESNHTMVGRNARSDRRLARIVKQKLSC